MPNIFFQEGGAKFCKGASSRLRPLVTGLGANFLARLHKSELCSCFQFTVVSTIRAKKLQVKLTATTFTKIAFP